MKKVLVFITLAVLLNGCAFKSVMDGEADDIIKARICSFGDKNYLVMLEAVFQATSKEYNRGVSLVTGHNDLRVSVYDLTNGSLIVRKKTGRQNQQPVEFLGCTDGNLWFYSFEDGIHSLDPLTLETKVSQESVFAENPELRDHLATCEWYQLPQFFQFNEITHQLVLTDDKGYRYLLDPVSIKAKRINWEYRSFDPRRDQPFVTSVASPQSPFALTGDLRKQIKVEGKEVNSDLTFLDGQFIADRNPARTVEGIDARLSGYMIRLEAIYPRIVEMNSLNGGAGPSRGEPLRDTLRLLENYRYSLEAEVRDLERYRTDVTEDGVSHSYVSLLSPDTTSFFVFHRSGTQKDAYVVISRIQMKNYNTASALWETEIQGLFHDPTDAEETNAFKEVFSKGSPEFVFSFFDIAGNKLIIVWMLHVHCLDLETGRVLWKFRV